MSTKAQALAAARRRWGKRAFVRENRRAMNAAERQAHVEKQRTLKAELDALDAKVKSLGNVWQSLLEESEFFLAVNGDEPSGTQFRAAVAKAREFQDTNDLRKATREEWERGRSGAWNKRWEAGYVHGSQIGDIVSIHEQADTLDELLAQIEPSRELVDAITDSE